MKGMQMNKFIAAEAAGCIGCHACEIACGGTQSRKLAAESRDFRPRIHVVGKGQVESGGLPSLQQCPLRYGLSG
jgi:Fe-S-cluster-containing hydrogenase component 2